MNHLLVGFEARGLTPLKGTCLHFNSLLVTGTNGLARLDLV